MPKLTIEIDGPNSNYVKIFVDDKPVGLIQNFKLEVDVNPNLLNISAEFPDIAGFDLTKNSSLHEISKMQNLLESCGVKCKIR